MRSSKHLGRQFAVVVAVTALCGTSAFAETRHHDETNRGEARHSDRSGRVERENHEQRSNENWNRDHSSNQPNQSNQQRSNQNWNRDQVNNERQFDRGRVQSGVNNRGHVDNNYRGNYNNNYRGGYRNNNNYRGHTPYFYNGRISRFERWNSGFRVWLGGAPYPFFVPEAYFRSHGLRIGLSIGLGGYYNPLGYYDYDPYYYGGGTYGGGTAVARGDVRGVVETVDYRRNTVVVRDDYSGEFVTAVMRGRDRTFDTLRPGDYVQLQGDWVRGTFEAYGADLLDSRDYDRRY